MPQLAKPVQGLIVLILAVIVGVALMTQIGNNDDEGFLGVTNSEEISVPAGTPEPNDGTSPDAQAMPEVTDNEDTSRNNSDSADSGSNDSDESTTVEYKSPLGADVNLIFQALMFMGLLFGASFAVRKDYTTHRNIMTFLIIVNWFSIMGRMADSASGIADTNANEVIARIHMIGGSITMLFASYLAIRMWFENMLPSWIKIEPIKIWMRLTLAIWLLVLIFGFVTYFGKYG